MYPQVNVELAKANMNRRDLANAIGMPYNTLLMKLAGKTIITLDEAMEIKDKLKSELPVEVIFKKKPVAS